MWVGRGGGKEEEGEKMQWEGEGRQRTQKER